MHTTFNRLSLLFTVVAASSFLATHSKADPLANEVLKFKQEPMINTQIGTQFYHGHDELSTIYGPGNNAAQPIYQGQFMADDFSDTVSTPVVHITWWGSYHNVNGTIQPPVQQFLIAFDSDDPAIQPSPGNPGSPSKPKSPMQFEVVTPGLLTPGSGTFTETFTNFTDNNGDPIYKYNAELANPFPEQANTVYWLKIAAMVNVPSVPPNPGTATEWGWHNRDYTINDPLASSAVPFPGGEINDGGTPANPIWHFQDDAVQGRLTFDPTNSAGINQQIIQTNPIPQNYIDLFDGPVGIGSHSKDLAFELYTPQQTTVPEPAACVLMAFGLAGMLATRRRSRSA